MAKKSSRFRLLVRSQGRSGAWWLIVSSRFKQYAYQAFNEQSANRTSEINHCRLYDGKTLIDEWNPAWLPVSSMKDFNRFQDKQSVVWSESACMGSKD